MVKNKPANAGYMGLTPGVRKIQRRRKRQPIPVFLPGEIPRTEESGGLQSMGLQELDVT